VAFKKAERLFAIETQESIIPYGFTVWIVQGAPSDKSSSLAALSLREARRSNDTGSVALIRFRSGEGPQGGELPAA
jgi:hypothetical protein